MKRRHLLLGGLAAAAGAALWARPRDQGAPHDEYFRQLNALLRREGPMRPLIVIDLDRLDANVDEILRRLPAGKAYRVVSKSVPAAGLIDYVMRRAGTQRLMVFHQPFLNAHVRDFPAADLLLGKPLPVRSAAHFYDHHQPGAFDPARQLQWLVDTPQRLREYRALASARALSLRVNIELNVGLHRGGVTAGPELADMLAQIAAHPGQLQFAGFMGYDPHVAKVPSLLASRQQLLARAMAVYQGAVDQLRTTQPGLWADTLTLNTAGSPTYRLHDRETVSNELAMGSALVKPSDFDIDTLQDHVPAVYIATPVLKSSEGLRIPGLDDRSQVISWWDVNQRRAYFTYGGYWKARYESPRGLRNSGLYGHSTNQELVLGSPRTALAVDDQVFLRPTQSEFVLLQFGDLVAVRGGRIEARWPVFPQLT